LIAGTLCAPAVLAPRAFAKGRIDKSRISAITDEIGLTSADAIAFAHQYGLRWVEVRNNPDKKREYAQLPEVEVKEAAASFAANNLRVSFMNTSLLKFAWPGSEPVRRRPESDEQRAKRQASEQKRWDSRKEDTRRAVNAARILGCDKIRIFTGSRVADPNAFFPRIAEVMNELLPIAEEAKVHLLIENEDSQNVGSSAELAAVMEMLPSKWIGYNWDPENTLRLKETPFPDGYRLLPKKRMLNVQFKGKTIMKNGPEPLDWAAIIHALEKDGYQGQIGLETHIFDGTLIQAAHESMEQMLRIVG
jgi:sugar phosphate isomerase/epimerase